jgi:hypothetical protein
VFLSNHNRATGRKRDAPADRRAAFGSVLKPERGSKMLHWEFVGPSRDGLSAWKYVCQRTILRLEVATGCHSNLHLAFQRRQLCHGEDGSRLPARGILRCLRRSGRPASIAMRKGRFRVVTGLVYEFRQRAARVIRRRADWELDSSDGRHGRRASGRRA